MKIIITENQLNILEKYINNSTSITEQVFLKKLLNLGLHGLDDDVVKLGKTLSDKLGGSGDDILKTFANTLSLLTKSKTGNYKFGTLIVTPKNLDEILVGMTDPNKVDDMLKILDNYKIDSSGTKSLADVLRETNPFLKSGTTPPVTPKTSSTVISNTIPVKQILADVETHIDSVLKNFGINNPKINVAELKMDIQKFLSKTFPNGVTEDELSDILQLKLNNLSTTSIPKGNGYESFSNISNILDNEGKKIMQDLTIEEKKLSIKGIKKGLRPSGKALIGYGVIVLTLIDLLIGKVLTHGNEHYTEFFLNMFNDTLKRNDIHKFFLKSLKEGKEFTIKTPEGNLMKTSVNDINNNKKLVSTKGFRIITSQPKESSEDTFFIVKFLKFNINDTLYVNFKISVNYDTFESYVGEEDEISEQRNYLQFIEGDVEPTFENTKPGFIKWFTTPVDKGGYGEVKFDEDEKLNGERDIFLITINDKPFEKFKFNDGKFQKIELN